MKIILFLVLKLGECENEQNEHEPSTSNTHPENSFEMVQIEDENEFGADEFEEEDANDSDDEECK